MSDNNSVETLSADVEHINDNEDIDNKETFRKSLKTDSEDETDALVIRPNVSQPTNSKKNKKPLAFSLSKQTSAPLKHIKLKRLTKDKPASSTKAVPKVDPRRVTVDSIEAEKRGFKILPSKTAAQTGLLDKDKGPSPKKASEDQKESQNQDRRYRSKSPTSRSHSFRKNNIRKSQTPEKGTTAATEKKKNVKCPVDRIDDNSRRSKARTERAQTKTNKSEDLVASRLSEIEATIDILKSKRKPLFQLLALPRDGSSRKQLIAYSQKIVHFTSVTPTLTWAPNPKFLDDPYYKSRDFYLAHANADQQVLHRAIAESNHLKFKEDCGVPDTRRWYPKDDYLVSKGKEMLADTQAGKKAAGKGRVKRISLVDYDSADDKQESRKEEICGKKKRKSSLDTSALLIEGNSVKVKSKWDSDYEESLSDHERRNALMEVDESSAKPIEEEEEIENALVSQNQNKTEEPKQLVSEYEEFLKLVGTDSSQSHIQPLPTGVGMTVSNTIPITPQPATTKNNWDDESSPDNQKKASVVISKATGKKGSNVSVKVQKTKKKKGKKKKKAASDSDCSTESSDSSSSDDDKKTKSKRKKKKKRTKKVKVESESSSSESEEEEEKTKKKKPKKKNKDAENVLQDLQMKKIAIAKKLSQLDSISPKKSKKAIAKDLKMIEEHIHCISDVPTPKKTKMDKKEKKKKKKQSSSSENDSDVSFKHKRSKKVKRKKKTKKKETSSESSSDSDEAIVSKKKKKKKNTGKKDNKEGKKKDLKTKPELLNPMETKEEWRKRPAEDDITPIARSRPRLEVVDNSGWEDEDSKLKQTVDSITNDVLPDAIREADTEPSKSSDVNDKVQSLTNSETSLLADETLVAEEKPTRRNSDWEANSESDQGTGAWKVKQQNSRESRVTPEKEVRAFEAIALSLPPIVSKPTEPVLDLYSPGASDTDDLSSGIASPAATNAVIADPVFIEDSTSFSMSISLSVDKPAAVPPLPVVSSEPIDASVSSSTGCTVSQDDVYDPLAADSDASDDSRQATLPLRIGLDDIPLPELPSVADILLPGENPMPSQSRKPPRDVEKEKTTPLHVPIIAKVCSPEKGDLVSEKIFSDVLMKSVETDSPKSENDQRPKINRWDKINRDIVKPPVEAARGDNSVSFETIPLLIPKLTPVSLSNLPPPQVTKMPTSSFSSTGTKVQLNTHITMKTQSRLQSKVASVFQSDSDDEFASSNLDSTEKLKENAPEKEMGAAVDVTDFPVRNDNARDWEESVINDAGMVSSFTVEENRFAENLPLVHDESDKDRGDKQGQNEKDRDRSENKSDRSKRDDNRRRSNSPRKQDRRWTPERSTRKRSRSPDKRYRRRSRSVDKKDRRRRRTPSPRRRPRSPSPKKRRRHPSPRRQRTRSRSYSPKNKDNRPPRRSRSRSPVRRAVSPPKQSPVRRLASPSRRTPMRRSPSPRKRSPLRRSVTPRKRNSDRRSVSPRKRSPIRRSLSPRKRSSVRRSVSPRKRTPSRRSTTPRKRSPLRRPVSPGMRSPVRRGTSPVRRSPIRRRTPSPRRQSHSIPVIGHATEVNPPLPSTPFPESEEKMSYPMSVDARIMHEFGVKLEMSPPPPPLPAAVPNTGPAPVHLQTDQPLFYYPSPPQYQGLSMPTYSASQGGIVQVGNIMEVVPHAHAPPPPPPPPPPPKQQILQVGNMLQIVPTTRATAVVAPTPIASEPGPAVYSAVLQNPLIKAILAEREKIKKEKDARRAEREARRRARQAKREAKLMSVTEKLKKVERNEGLVLGQEVDEDEELLLEAMEPPSPPSPVEVVTSGDLPPAGKSILVTPTFTQANEKSKKNVIFADGLKPGDTSDGEEKTEALPKTLPKEKRFKKKVKKKVKVRIIRQVIQSDEEEDDLPPPSPPPGDPPPIFYVSFPFGEQVQYPVCQTSITTTTTKTTTLHIPAPLPQ